MVQDRLTELEAARQQEEENKREALAAAARLDAAAKRKAAEKAAQEWTDEEKRLLNKAVTRFPVVGPVLDSHSFRHICDCRLAAYRRIRADGVHMA